jgi:hypothetical protein
MKNMNSKGDHNTHNCKDWSQNTIQNENGRVSNMFASAILFSEMLDKNHVDPTTDKYGRLNFMQRKKTTKMEFASRPTTYQLADAPHQETKSPKEQSAADPLSVAVPYCCSRDPMV